MSDIHVKLQCEFRKGVWALYLTLCIRMPHYSSDPPAREKKKWEEKAKRKKYSIESSIANNHQIRH